MQTQPEENALQKAIELKAWSQGWRAGFYSKDLEPECPYSEPDLKKLWESGLVYGSLAKAQNPELSCKED